MMMSFVAEMERASGIQFVAIRFKIAYPKEMMNLDVVSRGECAAK